MNLYCLTILGLNIDEAKELFPPIFHLLIFFANSTIFMSFKRNRNSCSVPSYTNIGHTLYIENSNHHEIN